MRWQDLNLTLAESSRSYSPTHRERCCTASLSWGGGTAALLLWIFLLFWQSLEASIVALVTRRVACQRLLLARSGVALHPSLFLCLFLHCCHQWGNSLRMFLTSSGAWCLPYLRGSQTVPVCVV